MNPIYIKSSMEGYVNSLEQKSYAKGFLHGAIFCAVVSSFLLYMLMKG